MNMNCPKCSNANISGAKFCMACGCSLVSGAKNSIGKIIAAAIGLAAVTLIIGFAATGVLGARGKAPKNTVLRAEGQTAAPILRATGTAPKTILGAEGKAPEKMPADVFAWLEHLRKIEDRKNEITIKQLSELKVFEQMLDSAARSFKLHGFRTIVLIGDHGSYQANERAVADRLNNEWRKTPVRVFAATEYYSITQGAYAEQLLSAGAKQSEIGTHAGLADTSLMLAIDPSMVEPWSPWLALRRSTPQASSFASASV